MLTLFRLLILSAIALAGFAGVVAAQTTPASPTLSAPCKATSDEKDKLYHFDASTGRATGETKYRRSKTVQVVVENMNPFRYSYKLKADDQAISEPSIADLLTSIALPAGGNVATVEDAKENKEWIKKYDLPVKSPVTPANLSEAREAAARAVGYLENEVRRLGLDIEEQRITLSRPDATCGALLEAAGRMGQILDVPSVLFTSALEGVTVFEKFVSATPTRSELEAVASLAARLKSATETYEALRKALAGVAAVAATGPFHKVLTIGGYRQPTDVAITVERKDSTDAKAAAEVLHERTLNFGGRARFSASAGWSIARAGRQAFGRVQGYARSAAGAEPDATETVPVVGLTEDDSSRNGPLALVHVRVFDIPGDEVSLHMSLGATPASDDGAVRAEYIVGPSLGFAEDRFFATFGWHFGRTEVLQDSWFVGRAVPEEVTAVPIRHEAVSGFAFAISFKVK